MIGWVVFPHSEYVDTDIRTAYRLVLRLEYRMVVRGTSVDCVIVMFKDNVGDLRILRFFDVENNAEFQNLTFVDTVAELTMLRVSCVIEKVHVEPDNVSPSIEHLRRARGYTKNEHRTVSDMISNTVAGDF